MRRALSSRLRALRDLGPGSGTSSALMTAIRKRTDPTWGRIPEPTRQRLLAAIIVAAAAATIWFLLLPAAPCSFPGGDRCPPSDDAIALVPEDALAYAHLDTDPESDQFAAASEIAARVPLLGRLAIGGVGRIAGFEVDYATQIRPWDGGEMAVALLPSGTSVARVVMIKADDTAAAEDFAAQQFGPEQPASATGGPGVSVGQRGAAWAVEDGFLLLGTEGGVSDMLAAKQDGSHLVGSDGTAVLGELPAQRFAYAYLSAAGARALLSVRALEPLDTFIDSAATEGAAAAVTADGAGIHLTLRSNLDPNRTETSPSFFAALPTFTPTLTSNIGAGSLAYVGLGDPAASVSSLLDQAKTSSPSLVAAFRAASGDLEEQAGINIGNDLLPLLGSEAALSVQPVAAGGNTATAPGVVVGASTPYVSLIAKGIDAGSAARSLAELQEPVAKALAPSEGDAGVVPVFETIQVAGVQAQLLAVSSAFNLTYATYDDRLVVATDSLGIEQARSTENGLDISTKFQDATADLPDAASLIAYFDISGLLSLGEQAGLAEDPAYAAIAPDLRSLAAAALAVDGSDDQIRTDLQIAVGERSEPQIDAPPLGGE